MTALTLALADFKDRRRRYAYFVTFAIVLYMAFLFVPQTGAEFYFTLTLNKYRGIYNSPWVGSAVAVSLSIFLSLVGFYLIKNTVSRDARSGVGELLGASSLSSTNFVLSKFLSNFFYLASLVAPLIVMAAVMQLIRAEDTNLQLLELGKPFLFLTLPNLVLVSAAATMFEFIPGLRGGFGNVVYYFLYMSMLMLPIAMETEFDLVGIKILESDMKQAFHAIFPDKNAGFSLGKVAGPMPEGVFTWDGVVWTSARIWSRAVWLAVAAVFLLISIPAYDRFDPAKVSKRAQKVKAQGGGTVARAMRTIVTSLIRFLAIPLSGFSFGRVVLAEIRLSLLGLPVFWYLITLSLLIVSLVLPTGLAGKIVMPGLWIMPILIWSQSGVRERLHGVDQVLSATPNPVLRQALAVWTSGVILAALCASGYGIRLIIDGNFAALYALCAGALFVPALALALGVLSNTSRTFEIVYLLLWYIGPLNNIHYLDYIGVYPETLALGMPTVYLLLALSLLALSLFTSSRQARS